MLFLHFDFYWSAIQHFKGNTREALLGKGKVYFGLQFAGHVLTCSISRPSCGDGPLRSDHTVSQREQSFEAGPSQNNHPSGDKYLVKTDPRDLKTCLWPYFLPPTMRSVLHPYSINLIVKMSELKQLREFRKPNPISSTLFFYISWASVVAIGILDTFRCTCLICLGARVTHRRWCSLLSGGTEGTCSTSLCSLRSHQGPLS